VALTKDTEEAMAHTFNDEFQHVPALIGSVPKAQRGDWKTLRDVGNTGMDFMASLLPAYPDGFPSVEEATHFVTAEDGTQLEARWYTNKDATPGSGVVYAHGGAMILGDLDQYAPIVATYVEATGVPILSIGYRLAPEFTGETPARDVYAAIKWLNETAATLGVDPDRIAVMGESGGGGTAAGAAIIAREQGLPLAHQILIYAMLDDRNVTPAPAMEPFTTWTYDSNFTAWTAVLGDARGTDDVSPIVAPARLTDFAGLAPAYIEVGDLDIFRDEDISYAQRLAAAGVPLELHVHPGTPHAFEYFAPESQLVRGAMGDRFAVLRTI
jgi:acetyl esterase/lipase